MINPSSAIILAQQHARAGRNAEAEKIYREILRHYPNNAVAWHNLGMANWLQQRPREAILSVQKAVELAPDYVEAWNNLGALLSATDLIDDAIAALRKAAALKPNWAEPYINAGNMLRNRARYDEAIDFYRQAARTDPRNPEPHHILGSALARQGLRESARQHLTESLRLNPKDVVVNSSLCLLSNYDPNMSPAILRNEHEWWDRLQGQGMAKLAPHTNSRDPDRKLRVGYVSPDFRVHPVARFMVGVYEAHDPAQFELYSYAQMNKSDAMTERFAARSKWRSTYGQQESKIDEMIRADQIDILIDLAGHTGGNRITIFPWRAAPVQAAYLGYPSTAGLKSIQYRITDSVADPENEESAHTEELIRLPGVWCCFEPHADAPQIVDPPSLRNGYITFGSMQNLLKLNERVIDLWTQVLRAAPTSRLHIYRDTLDGMGRRRLIAEFTQRGLDPQRLELRNSKKDGAGHLSEYEAIDISLDTLPWSGHATTCESLWMGVPMITQRGTRHAGRMSASILTAIGAPELIAETPEQFVEIATALATDSEKLKHLRHSLREQMRSSPVCDPKSFTRNLEAAYRDIWRRWCAQDDAA